MEEDLLSFLPLSSSCSSLSPNSLISTWYLDVPWRPSINSCIFPLNWRQSREKTRERERKEEEEEGRGGGRCHNEGRNLDRGQSIVNGPLTVIIALCSICVWSAKSSGYSCEHPIFSTFTLSISHIQSECSICLFANSLILHLILIDFSLFCWTIRRLRNEE